MLQIENIRKEYRTGPLVQQALDGVSLSLRDNEFVAVLGPSGSGKTTLLNIIGGLDSYDSGSLIINGVSTTKYTARDWDSYRNHSVGFVFQSYNLIPHQSVLANVELALTIGGVSQKERRQRARDALDKVGLHDHMHKKPAQLSGGQMQRVAIARALVNDPDILLADEPTGALDSETSLQVMGLLKEVARDRLVVMVTHNPDLAERFATRIVRLKDGRITDDSDPYAPETESPGVHRNLGKASMSRLTSLTLSFNNLWTKKVRTLLVAFAGSIGIIGIALILSMSNGVDRYIQEVEQTTLKSYPLTISDTSINLSALVNRDGEEVEKKDAEVLEWRSVTNLLSRFTVNDMASLRTYLESGKSDIYDHVQAIEYGYNVTPQIYRLEETGIRQVNPDQSFAALGMGSTDSSNSLLSSFSSTDSFHAMPEEKRLYMGQYNVKAGRWPENELECVLVLTKNSRVSDLTLYAMGLKDPAELAAMLRSFAAGEPVETDLEEAGFSYADFLGLSFRVLPASALCTYDESYGIWTDRSTDESFLRQQLEQAEELQIVGVVQPKEGVNTPTLNAGINYPAALRLRLIQEAAESDVVRAQLADPETDVFTGQAFGTSAQEDLDLSTLFTVDEEALKSAFQLDPSVLADPDLDLIQKLRAGLHLDPEVLRQAIRMKTTPAELRDLMTSLLSREENTYAGNLHKLGWADAENPSTIAIYPLDFDAKEAIKDILEDYNLQAEEADTPEKVITYTDVVDTLMSSVTEIVDAISGVLIGFVAVSLVVSSVMIGVITYISVLERRKEIGILRAIGASKRNISQVFNAETFIIGALAGLLGVGITWLLLIPVNRIIASLAEKVRIRAYLPVTAAAILVGLSILLTMLGGFIPSKKAARQDPVAALRSE